MKRKRKSDKDPLLEKIVFVTAILNLIKAIAELLE